VKWINDLKNPNGTFIPHPLPIQQDVHWANPSGLCERRQTPPDCAGSPKGQYAGPVPTVTHLHGAHTTSNSDGIPEAWYLPAGGGAFVPYSRGSDWSQIAGTPKEDGAAVFEYPNDQPPAFLFFHDHTLGITAQNVYMGLVGGYVIRGNSTTDVSSLPSGSHELPLVIQDKSFYADGSLQFTSEGNTIVVNGKTWPYVNVEPRHYRLRIVSGTDERYLLLSFDNDLKFTQIGGDAGFLPHPIQIHELTLTAGERADVIVDFSELAGQDVVLTTDGVDALQFKVGTSVAGTDTTSVPNTLPYEGPLCPASNPHCGENNPRRVSLFDHTLGKVTGSGLSATGVQMLWDDPSTENPLLNSTEVWEIYNFSGDSHPIHLHEVRYEVIDRINLTTGAHKPPSPGESGRMDTALANGHEILRVRAHFDLGGLYAWHCHIIEHEDEEMMRPMCVVDPHTPCHTK
jgi:FtsP/CotA-like multicopper oxidase with cupredoxin domain